MAAVPARRRLYVDSSAYLCMLLAEDEAERLTAETGGAELLSSVLLVLEADAIWFGWQGMAS